MRRTSHDVPFGYSTAKRDKNDILRGKCSPPSFAAGKRKAAIPICTLEEERGEEKREEHRGILFQDAVGSRLGRGTSARRSGRGRKELEKAGGGEKVDYTAAVPQ